MNLISFDQFSQHVDSYFTIIAPSYMPIVNLKLLQVKLIISNQIQEHFTLIFQGPSEPLLNQQVYELEHEQMGELSLFMVPIARKANGMQYEVVFNRLL